MTMTEKQQVIVDLTNLLAENGIRLDPTAGFQDPDYQIKILNKLIRELVT